MSVTAHLTTIDLSTAAFPRVTRAAQHRRPAPVRGWPGRALDVVGRVGTTVTLVSVLVVATAVGGLLDGAAGDPTPTVTVTFGSH